MSSKANKEKITLRTHLLMQNEDGRNEVSCTYEAFLLRRGENLCMDYDDAENGGRTRIYLFPDKAEIIREGSMSSKMRFQVERQTECPYSTPFGTLTLQIKTHFYETLSTTEGGALQLKYALSAGEQTISENHLTLQWKGLKD